jgi:hypothetical protein
MKDNQKERMKSLRYDFKQVGHNTKKDLCKNCCNYDDVALKSKPMIIWVKGIDACT